MIEDAAFDYNEAYQRGNGVYLAAGETEEGVITADAEIFKRHGVNPQEAGQSLRQLVSSYNEFKHVRTGQPQELIPDVRVKRRDWPLAQEEQVFKNKKFTSYQDWWVWTDTNNGNKAGHRLTGPTVVSNMLPELISSLGFCEGTVYYGLKPEWVIDMHRQVQRNKPEQYNPQYSKEAWDKYQNIYPRDFDNPNLAAQQIIAASTHKFEDERMTLYIARGDLDLRFSPNEQGVYSANPTFRKNTYWGLLIGNPNTDSQFTDREKLFDFPVDAKSLPLIRKGENSVIRLFPYTDKLIG